MSFSRINISKRRIAILAALALFIPPGIFLGCGLLVKSSATGRLYSDATAIPKRNVGVLLGCGKTIGNGRINLYFKYRIEAAAALFAAGKVERIIVSGDNGSKSYDEASDMKAALIAKGIPAEKIHCDYAGFRTFDSIVRAKEVFGQTQFTIISQEFHNERAIFIASNKGIDAIGFNAQAVTTQHALKMKLREQFSRVKSVLDVYLLQTRPKFLGPKIEIGETAQAEKSGAN